MKVDPATGKMPYSGMLDALMKIPAREGALAKDVKCLGAVMCVRRAGLDVLSYADPCPNAYTVVGMEAGGIYFFGALTSNQGHDLH